jgi:hypothetical protein
MLVLRTCLISVLDLSSVRSYFVYRNFCLPEFHLIFNTCVCMYIYFYLMYDFIGR